MRVLIYSTSSNDTQKLVDSLKCLGEHDVHLFNYDKKWNEHVNTLRAMANRRDDPKLAAEGQKALYELNQGTYRAPMSADVSADVEMLKEIDKVRPEVAIYISAWEGQFVPSNEILTAINRKVPLIHHCCDASDPPWWPQMVQFEKDGCFAFTWNIDGGNNWPGGNDWAIGTEHEAWGAKPANGYQGPVPRRFYPNTIPAGFQIKGLTTLTPVDPSYFAGPHIAFRDRPFRIGYAGNTGGWMRKAVIDLLQGQFGHAFQLYQRDDNPNSYAMYCEYLRYCQCIINVPFSGSNAAKQVKGRVVEAGWANTCLLEWRGAPTEQWFEAGDEFETYAGIADLEAVVESVLEDPATVEEMADRLAARVRKEHHPKIIWDQVFAALK